MGDNLWLKNTGTEKKERRQLVQILTCALHCEPPQSAQDWRKKGLQVSLSQLLQTCLASIEIYSLI